jgi:hypothetical protein
LFLTTAVGDAKATLLGDPYTILTGTNDGSGLAGYTTLTVVAAASGTFSFNWTFNTLDAANYECAGYLIGFGTPGAECSGFGFVGNGFTEFAGANGEYGSVSAFVAAGQEIGFEVGSFDNTGSPGVLTITNFTGPGPVQDYDLHAFVLQNVGGLIPNGFVTQPAAPSAPEPGSLAMLLLGAAAATRLTRYLKNKQLPPRIMLLVAAGGMGAAWMSGPVFAQTAYSGSNVTGQLTFLYSVNLTAQAQQAPAGAQILDASAPSNPEVVKSNPLLRHPASGANKLMGSIGAVAATPSLTVKNASGVFGFNGLSQADQRLANGGNQVTIEPPNQSIAVANGFVLEGVNDAVQIFSTSSGSSVLPVVLSSNQVFGLSPTYVYSTGISGVYLTDMRVFYDSLINRWFIIQRAQDENSAGTNLSSSHLYIAVSQTGDPTGSYNIYLLNTTNPTHSGCPCLDDYPNIGADQYGLHIAWNEYNITNPNFPYFVDVAILSISKASLASGSPSPTAYELFVPQGVGFGFALQPATTPPGAANYVAQGGIEYFASTIGDEGNQLAIWAMTGTSTLGTSNPSPVLYMTVVPTISYLLYGSVPQPNCATAVDQTKCETLAQQVGGNTEYLDGFDTRVQSLSYAGGRLYLTFQTGLYDQNANYLQGAIYAVISPTFRGTGLAAQVLNQGTLTVTGNHLLRPSLAVNAQGVGAIGVTLVGTNIGVGSCGLSPLGCYFPSAAYIPFQFNVVPSTIQIAAAGQFPEDGFTGYSFYGGDGIARWGDYNSAVVASDGSVWTTVQWIGNYPRTPYANWNSYVVQIKP